MSHIAHLRNQFKSMNTFEQSYDYWWSIFTTLEDLDFADDIALLSSRHSDTGMQEKTERLSHFASQLQLNANKTEEMRFNVTSSNN